MTPLSAFLDAAAARCNMTVRSSTGEPDTHDDQWTRNVATVDDLKTALSLLRAASEIVELSRDEKPMPEEEWLRLHAEKLAAYDAAVAKLGKETP